MATNCLFSGDDILSFIFFWKPLLQLEGGQQYLQKKFISARGNRFLHFSSDTRIEVAFRSSEIVFFKESFILASGSGFSINYKLCAFIRSFFLLVDTMLEIRCKPIRIFLKNTFPLDGKKLTGVSEKWKKYIYIFY